ncbi:hypothetical protein [Dongia sp. agr-C8]
MATRFFGLNRGEQALSVTKDTSTTGKAIELAVNDAVGLKKSEILVALRQFEQAILDDRATPFI